MERAPRKLSGGGAKHVAGKEERTLLTRMIHRSCKFNVTEMTRAFRHTLSARFSQQSTLSVKHKKHSVVSKNTLKNEGGKKTVVAHNFLG